MKKLLLILVIAGAIIFFFFNEKSVEIDPADTVDDVAEEIIDIDKVKKNNKRKKLATGPGAKLSSKDLPKRIEVPQTDKASREYLAETLFQYTNYDRTQVNLVEDLERLNLNPTQTKTSNSLGTSNIIRTEKSLKGTRYFHAQFKDDGNGNEILQHMSFELPPGPLSFAQGIAILKSRHKLPAKMKIDEPDFKAWSLDDGYVVWVKKTKAKDLKNHPFNAYDKSDIGTVIVSKEIDIHPDGDHTEDHDH